MTDEQQHITSTLRRARALLGRPLTPAETAYVATLLIGWVDALAAGLTPEQVVALARQEVEASSVH